MRATHYRAAGRVAICGRTVPREHLTNEIGEVGCFYCDRRIQIAWFQVLGQTKTKARQWFAANRRDARARSRP